MEKGKESLVVEQFEKIKIEEPLVQPDYQTLRRYSSRKRRNYIVTNLECARSQRGLGKQDVGSDNEDQRKGRIGSYQGNRP